MNILICIINDSYEHWKFKANHEFIADLDLRADNCDSGSNRDAYYYYFSKND